MARPKDANSQPGLVQCGLLTGQALFGVFPSFLRIAQNSRRDVGWPDDAAASDLHPVPGPGAHLGQATQ
jgi:hypothetical protein